MGAPKGVGTEEGQTGRNVMSLARRRFSMGPESAILHHMVAAIKQRVTVGSGGVIELRSPELRPGSEAEVIVLVDLRPEAPAEPTAPLTSFIGSGKGSFGDAAQADSFI